MQLAFTTRPYFQFCIAALVVMIAGANLDGHGTGRENDEGTNANNSKDLADEAQQYFELRIYRTYDFEKQKAVEKYLENALMPALKKQGIENIGVFNRMDDPNDHSVFVLITYPKIEMFTEQTDMLAKDEEYQAAAKEYSDRPLKDPNFVRIESRFMKAFAGMPTLEPPKQFADGKPRIFELRLYQSHTERHAAKKVEMFNKGEIQIMRDADMGPVFFGQTLIGADAPNLIYMLSADDEESHKKHWQAFLKHEDWKRMSKMEEYKDTVSKIENWFLKPVKFSRL